MSGDLVGTVVGGKYKVVSKIGTGGMGDVYEAEDVDGGWTDAKNVALKVLRLDDETLTARFLREAKTMSLFAHPNIVELVEVGKLDDGRLFFAAELVRGDTLRGLIEAGRVAPKRALGIVRQVLDALSHAHAMGVVHRDIKPENVMLVDGEGDVVKILDFGVAKLLGDTPAVLGEGTLTIGGHGALGTPYYMSPEAVLGTALDARADIYSIGVLLFEMLTGKPPYTHEDVAVLMRMHAAAPIPPVPNATPEVALLVTEALAKKPDLRFKSAAEMIAAVDAAVHALDQPASSRTDVFGNLPMRPPATPPAGTVTTEQPAIIEPPPGSSLQPMPPPSSERSYRASRVALPGVAPYQTPVAGSPIVGDGHRPSAMTPSGPTRMEPPPIVEPTIEPNGAPNAAPNAAPNVEPIAAPVVEPVIEPIVERPVPIAGAGDASPAMPARGASASSMPAGGGSAAAMPARGASASMPARGAGASTPARGAVPSASSTPVADIRPSGAAPHSGGPSAEPMLDDLMAHVAYAPPYVPQPFVSSAPQAFAPSAPQAFAPSAPQPFAPSSPHLGGPVTGIVNPVENRPSAPMFAPPMPATHPNAPSKLAALVRQHAKLVLAAVGALVILVVVIAIATSGENKAKATSTAGAKPEKRAVKKRPDLARGASELIAAGHPARAADLIEKEDIGDDDDTLVVLGHARIGANRRLEGLAAYERAIALDGKHAADPRVRANVQRVLESRDAVAAVVALELALRLEPPAQDLIKQLATNGKVGDVRRRAYAIAERERFSDGIDRVESGSLDLAQATTCEDRLVAIAKLRRIADPRGIAALKKVKTVRCIEREIAEAIAFLESQTPAPAPNP